MSICSHRSSKLMMPSDNWQNSIKNRRVDTSNNGRRELNPETLPFSLPDTSVNCYVSNREMTFLQTAQTRAFNLDQPSRCIVG